MDGRHQSPVPFNLRALNGNGLAHMLLGDLLKKRFDEVAKRAFYTVGCSPILANDGWPTSVASSFNLRAVDGNGSAHMIH
ncbi:hypothetical protein CEXT_308771 [Caerostris extrusa]|uniref:Uncharacterized protein n=1 Tax=Caerostris extrusa TaxID=172846 RepID=A0AAV4WNJ1_CAEEX|nr:hypothetical protein CEXT_308771 [Caerostris extrusa]